MKLGSKIFTPVIIISLLLSIIFCAYIPALSNTASSGHHHSENFSLGHSEHLQSLTLAVIPSLVLLAVFLSFYILFFGAHYFALPVLELSIFNKESKLRRRRELKYYFFNPRSPPVY